MSCDKPLRMYVGETELFGVDFGPKAGDEGWETKGRLSAGEILTAGQAVLVTSLPAASLTVPTLAIANKAINTAELNLKGRTVAVGEAVQFSIAATATGTAGATAFEDGEVGTLCEITITVVTNSSPARTLIQVIQLQACAAGTL